MAKRGTNKVKDFYVGSDGVRWKNVALTAGAVVGGLVAIRITSRTVRWAVAAPPAQQVPTDIVFLPVPRAQAGALAGWLRPSDPAGSGAARSGARRPVRGRLLALGRP